MTQLDGVRPEKVPSVLAGLPQWVLWQLRARDNDSRPTKIPVTADQRPASSTDSETWTDFRSACAAYGGGGFTGIGFVFAKDGPFVGIDLDGCRDPETGHVSDWARQAVKRLNSYAEISPSGTGIKVFARGKWPKGIGNKVAIEGEEPVSDKAPALEVYDSGRYFAVTGWKLAGPDEPTDAAEAITWLQETYFPGAKHSANGQQHFDFRSDDAVVERARKYLAKIPPAVSGAGGHNQTFHAACILVLGFELSEGDALGLLREWNDACQPPWSEAELVHKVQSAQKQTGERGYLRNASPARWDSIRVPRYQQPRQRPAQTEEGAPDEPEPVPILSAGEMMDRYPELRAPVIDGLLREGETMNLISASKVGKSWTVLDQACAIATGTPWLGYPTTQGRVLLIDNELHPETLTSRLRRMAESRGDDLAIIRANIDILSLRGRLQDLYKLRMQLAGIEPGTYRLIIVDAFYRALPLQTDENDNGNMAQLYNAIDGLADRVKTSFVLVHHSSKGSQAEKSVTDVGSGAGAQSRAVDCHLVLRAHETEHVYVLDAAVRSFPPVEPRCLRWSFPLWAAAPDLDPASLRVNGRKAKSPADDAAAKSKDQQDELDLMGLFDRLAAKSPDGVVGLNKLCEASPYGVTKFGKILFRLTDTRLLEEVTMTTFVGTNNKTPRPAKGLRRPPES